MAADQVYSTASLSVLRSLGSTGYPAFTVAVAYDGAGDLAAGTTTAVPTPDLYIYSPGASTAVNAYSMYSLSNLGGNLAPRGLGWLPDGSQVFGVLNRTTSYALAVVANPTVVQPDPTTTVLNCSLGSSLTIGQATPCTAVVTDTVAGGTTPTGVVTFAPDPSGGSFSSNSCTLSATSILREADCSVSYTPAQFGSGTQTITASYGGDGHHAASSGQATIYLVLRPTSTVVTCSPGAVAVGQATPCTATVTDTTSSPTTPTGVVAVTSDTSGGSFSGSSCTLSPASSAGQAACSFSYTPGEAGTGTQTITASYGGDGTHYPGSGQAAIAVTLRVTGTVLACQQVNPVLSKCTATVSDTSPGSASAPSGTVSFTSSGPGVFSATQCTLSVSGTLASSCTVYFATPPGVPMKGQTLTVNYGGDSTHEGGMGRVTLT